MDRNTAMPDRRAVTVCAVAVFVVAVMLRLPSCYESFWIDELHTAWSIWDELSDVEPRARIGNQTPLYFQFMWLWKQVVGESEVALRLSSVLMSAGASLLLVIAVTHCTGRISAGLLSGLILSVDSNSLFFGTEFRPYASLMLLSVIATWSAVLLLQESSRVAPANLRLLLIGSSCLAVMLHPTALVAFGILVATTLAICGAYAWRSSERWFHFHLSDLASLAIVVALLITLAGSSLSDSWEHRQQWQAFGKATTWRQLWKIWPWTATLIVPFILGLPFVWKQSARQYLVVAMPPLIVFVTTDAFFIASFNDWVPLWHRRYFIAVLPMLAWTAGVWSTMGLSHISNRAVGVAIAGVFLVSITSLLMRQQGTLKKIAAGQRQLVVRGEDWRSAVRFVKDRRQGGLVFLDSGLIEVQRYHDMYAYRRDRIVKEYLQFPLRGPYAISASVATPRTYPAPKAYGSLLYSPNSEKRASVWIISRSSYARLRDWCESIELSQFHRPEYRRFGRIWVARVRAPTFEEWKGKFPDRIRKSRRSPNERFAVPIQIQREMLQRLLNGYDEPLPNVVTE